jgi:hypothetical protein
MTPEEKAKDLFEKFEDEIFILDDVSPKTMALICVDEIISACEYNNVESYNTDWWKKVKQEITNL